MSAGQTTITYGDTTIYNVHTKRFHQEAAWDDSQHHSPYARTIIEVSGLLHGTSNASLHDHRMGRGAGTPSSSHKALRAILLHPRRRFEMRVGCAADGTGGEIVFECNPIARHEQGGSIDTMIDPAGVDLNGGPKCTAIDIQHVAGNEVFRVQATFEICKRECNAAGGAGASPNPVRSLTWSVADEIDQNFTTSRTYTGRLVLNSATLDPNSFRGWLVPPVLPGMMRRNMRFEVARDRLSLDFTIHDREVHYAPPAPATSWHFEHHVECGLEALTRVSSVNVTLAGDRYTPKKALINLAMQIVETKLLPAEVQQGDGEAILEHLSVTDVYGDDESRIHATARVRYAFDNGIDAEQKVALGQLGLPLDDPANPLPGYLSDYSRGAPQRGETAEFEGPIQWKGAIVAAFGDACGRARTLAELARSPELKPIRGEEEPAGDYGDPEVDVDFRTVPALPAAPPSFMSLGHAQAMFLSWKMETVYHSDDGTIALPVAGRGAGGSGPSNLQDTARFVRLHSPVATRTVRVTGERVGAWPDFPTAERHTDANGITVVPLDTKVLAPTVDWTPDGKRLYRASVEYKQGMSRPLGPSETLATGYNPWDNAGLHGMPGTVFSVSLAGTSDTGE